MQVTAINESKENGKNPAGKGRFACFWRTKAAHALLPILLFLLAFGLRALYNCVFMEHRIAHFGDAYNFLRSGTCLLEAVLSSENITDFLGKIYHSAPPQAQLLQSMTSLKLTDRLLIDGPVFPAYLALIEWLSGVNPFKPIFDAYTVQLGLCNSFVDALSCVLVYICGRLAFNSRTGLIAALIFAFYPASIINTQHCYSEPFSYFLLNIWTALSLFLLLRHRKNKFLAAACWCGTGLSTGMLMLSKPAFILLPPMVLAAVVPVSIWRHLSNPDAELSKTAALFLLLKKYAGRALLAFIGLSVILAPWVFFNKAATGQYSVFVNRVPSFNIFHGNQLRTDAWRCYPFYGTFPGESKAVFASLLEDAGKKPLPFIGLQFKKVARLWSGVWNEYHYSLFGVPLQLQSLFHQLLLLTATVSLSFLLCASRCRALSRSFVGALVLGTIILFHFAYIPFEAISRYAITAMPAVILLAARLLEESAKSRAARASCSLLISAAALSFSLIAASGTLASFIACVLPYEFLDAAPILAFLAELLCFGACFALIRRHLFILLPDKSSRTLSLLIPGLASLLACVVAAFYTIQSFDWREWSCSLNSKQAVRQVINLPKSIPDTATAFVLVDMGSDTLAPRAKVKVNGELLKEAALPLAQLQPDNADILQCLAIQAEGMSLDLRSFRNWWVVPFKRSILRPGADNLIELYYQDDSAHAIVYGDFHKRPDPGESDGQRFLPSLRSFSYTKGFTTFDHRDPRVFEEIPIQGKTVESARFSLAENGAIAKDKEGDGNDLSDSLGRQYGSYRIRLLIASGESSPQISEIPELAVTLVGRTPQLVVGGNPASFVPEKPVIDLPAGLKPGTRVYFSCQTRSLSGNHPCFVNLNFSGMDKNNEEKVWNSMWQPIGIPASKNFKETSFSDFIPEQILRLQHLQIRTLFSPCLPDYVFLKRKDALKTSMEIKEARLMLLNPLDIPPLESRKWTVY